MRQLEVTGTTLHITQEIWVYWLPEAEFLAWMFCSCKESLWLISFKAIPSKNSVVVTPLTILVGQGKLQIQHVTASKPNWEYTNKYSPQCLDFSLRQAIYTNTPLSCGKQAQRRENFLVCVERFLPAPKQPHVNFLPILHLFTPSMTQNHRQLL